MDAAFNLSKSVGNPSSDESLSFEVIKRFWSVGSGPSENPAPTEDEDNLECAGLLKPDSQIRSSLEDAKALDDLTSPYSAPVFEDQTSEDDDEREMMEDCIQIGQKCLEYCKAEQTKLQSLVASANESPATIPKEISIKDQQTDSSLVGQADSQNEVISHAGDTTIQGEEASILPERQFSTYMQIFENKIYPRIIMAVLIGFIVSFVLFFTYSVVFESMKMQQIQTFENMTKEERQEKEKYRKETDSFRETLMHKSYEEARQHNDELKQCQKTKDSLKADLTSVENELFRVNLEAKELDNGAKLKVESLRAVVEDLKKVNKRLLEELAVAKKSRNTYDFSVLLGLLVGLICVIFWGVRK